MQTKNKTIAGWVLTTLASLFLAMDGVMKLVHPGFVTEAMTKLGYPDDLSVPIGIVLLVCLTLYLVPRTTVLGAILLTGYLGGAVASHLRTGDSLFGHILFPVYIGLIVWGGLYLRNEPLRKTIGAIPF